MQTVEQVVAIPIAKLKPHPDNPRKKTSFEKKALAGLLDAIDENGITPLVVRKLDDGFQVLSGHRRLATSELAGDKTVPCVVREMDDFHALRFVLADNAQHEDPDPFLEARAIAKLLKEPQATLDSVAKGLGWSVRKVARRRELLNLCKTMLEHRQADDNPVSLWPVSWLEVVVQLDEVAQERWLKDSGIMFTSLQELEDSVAQYLRHLGKAPWDLNDAKLVAKAGACTTCPKQSANERNAGLFGVEKKADAGDVNKATCRDAECFKKKLDKWTSQSVAEKLEKNPELVCLHGAHNGYHDRNSRFENASARVPKGAEAMDAYVWTPAAKDDKGARQGIVVSGPSAGKTQWFKRRGDAPSSAPRGPSKKAELKQAEDAFEKQRAMAFAQHVGELLAARPEDTMDSDDVFALAAVTGWQSARWEQVEKVHAAAAKAVADGRFATFIWQDVRSEAIDLLNERWQASGEQLRTLARICLGALVDATEVTAIEERSDAGLKEPPELLALRQAVGAKKKPARGAKGTDVAADDVDDDEAGA